ncbi:MAG: AraC family transcriptional regulator [Clostridium sp.]|nr:AraC family transcriptional regulator [Clostridium sp.]MDU7085101.1 AraC family transcriptional regulator [Clostridium sp.]
MKGQKDWFTGIDYYHNYREKEITVERKIIKEPTKISMHEQVEMVYVLGGEGIIKINGCDYKAEEGSFFCMYAHHFYSISSITSDLKVVIVKFYIGLFMYMSWERHPKDANARLVYDTCPRVFLQGTQRSKVQALIEDILEESRERRFGSMNILEYKTLELHTYFCRYAYERIGVDKKQENQVWGVIQRVVLTTSENLELQELAKDLNCAPRTLNAWIKQTCGYTFFQLKQFGKILNACALLHFPELSMEYISDILGFSSKQSFYRLFAQYCKMTPREYQKSCIGNEEVRAMNTGMGMQFLQYIHMNFMQDISLEGICEKFFLKPYTARETFEEIFGDNFNNILNEIRISYACAFLRSFDYTVLEIANMCGFESLSTFQRTFKAYMNQSPSQYRKLL